MKLTEKIVNIETGEETFIEREETIAEKNARLESEKLAAEIAAKNEAAAVAKAEILAKLGLTEDEAKLLLG